jgi:hypothetical protein
VEGKDMAMNIGERKDTERRKGQDKARKGKERTTDRRSEEIRM